MTKRTRNFWIEVVLLVLIIGSIAIAIIASEFKPLNKNDIQLVVSDLRSFAASGRELISQDQKGQLTERFFSTQIELLGEKVSSSHQALLDSESDPAAKQTQQEASDLASQLVAAISELQASPHNEVAVAQRLSKLESTAKQMEERLKHE